MEKTVYSDFIKVNIAPYSAKKIGVYNQNTNERVGEIQLPESFKPANYGQRLYRFGLLSDVHIDIQGDPRESQADFRNALQVLNNKESVDFVCICGDISMYGSENEFAQFKSNVDTYSPTTTVYTTTGNHDCPSSGINESIWQKYTGNKRCFEFTKNKTDHFLFFGMNKYNFNDAYLQQDIEWLKQKLKQYEADRCFIFTHLFFPDKAGNLNKIYPSDNWLDGMQLIELLTLNNTYKNAIWFSGHSHWKWYLQKYQDIANVYQSYDATGGPTCGWCVHCPSCAYPIDSNGGSREERPLQSEGAIVDVYADHIDIRGVSFKDADDQSYVTKYLPVADYRLVTNNKHKYLKSVDFLQHTGVPAKNPYLVEDIPDSDYVRIKFTADRQGKMVKGAYWVSNATKATIYVEDVIYESPAESSWNQNSKDFGFYDENDLNNRTLVSGTSITLSSDGYAEFLGPKDTGYDYNTGPLTVKLKAYVIFESSNPSPEPEPQPGGWPPVMTNVPYLTAKNFTIQSSYNNATIRDIQDNTIEIIFNDRSKFDVKDNNWVSGVTRAYVEVEIASVYFQSGGAWQKVVDVQTQKWKDWIGFYSIEETTEGFTYKMHTGEIKVEYSLCQFNTSSKFAKYGGTYPVKIELRAKLKTE